MMECNVLGNIKPENLLTKQEAETFQQSVNLKGNLNVQVQILLYKMWTQESFLVFPTKNKQTLQSISQQFYFFVLFFVLFRELKYIQQNLLLCLELLCEGLFFYQTTSSIKKSQKQSGWARVLSDFKLLKNSVFRSFLTFIIFAEIQTQPWQQMFTVWS